MDTKLLQELREKREKAKAGGGLDKMNERRKKGLMTARDRLDALFDGNSFQESGLHVRHNCRDFELDKKEIPADGVVTGLGLVGGRTVGAASQDFTVVGGTLGNMHAQKMVDGMEQCLKIGAPFICFNDSGGARIQEGVASLSGYARVFNMNVKLSGVVPQISVISGPCAGGAAYSPALTDFIVMVRKTAHMFICGPEVIKAACGQDVTKDDVGGADVQVAVAGNAHFIANSDAEAIALVKKLLSFLPSNNMSDPPHDLSVPISTERTEGLEDLMPNRPNEAFDVRKVIRNIVDAGDFFETHAQFAQNIVVGFARMSGVVIGIIANQPCIKAGTVDIDASDKGARFIRFCNAFNIPLLTLVDTPGFLPGLAQERGGIIRHGAKMLFAYAASTVPMITVIMRKAYGGAYIAMCSKDLGGDICLAWPTAEIAVMGAEQAVRILYRKELDGTPDAAAKQAELSTYYRDRFAKPYQAASLGLVEDVIEPGETRAAVSMALRHLLTKRVVRPAKKHGNIPL